MDAANICKKIMHGIKKQQKQVAAESTFEFQKLGKMPKIACLKA
jgi:hypothetical protein